MSVKVLVIAGHEKETRDGQVWPCPDAAEKYALELATAMAARSMSVTMVVSQELLEHAMPFDGAPTIATVRSFRSDAEQGHLALGVLKSEKPTIVIRAASLNDKHREQEFVSRMAEIVGNTKSFVVDIMTDYGEALGRSAAPAMRNYVLRVRHDLAVMVDGHADGDGRFGVTVVTPEGGAFPCGDVRAESAIALVELIEGRRTAETVPLQPTHMEPCLFADHAAYGRAESLLALARNARMFSGTNGNASVRVSAANDLIVTPTGMDKSRILASELIYVQPERSVPDTWVYDGKRPSIDTSLQAHLYSAFPAVEAFLHVHADAGIFLSTDVTTSFPYPCGTREESREVEATMRRAKLDGNQGFNVTLLHHGYLFGFESGGVARMAAEWTKAVTEFRRAWLEQALLSAETHESVVLKPMFAGGHIVGAMAIVNDGFDMVHLCESWKTPDNLERLEQLCG